MYSLNIIAIGLLWVASVFDPVGQLFGIRYIAMGVASVALVFNIIAGKVIDSLSAQRWKLSVLLCLLMPFAALMNHGLRTTGNEFIDTSYLAAALLWLFSYLNCDKKTIAWATRLMVHSNRMMSFSIVAIFIGAMFGYGDTIASLYTESGSAFYGERSYAGIVLPYIYFIASPMLIFLIGWDFKIFHDKPNLRNFALLSISVFALFLTGTRAHQVLAIAAIPILGYLNFSRLRLQIVAVSIVAITLMLIILPMGEIYKEATSKEETNNSMKIELIKEYENIYDDPSFILLGQGFNAHEWYLPLRKMIAMEDKASKTELTYNELIRVFGLPITLYFMWLLLSIVWAVRNDANWNWVVVPALFFLVDSSTNPYLFSTNGMLPFGLIASISAVFYIDKIDNVIDLQK